MPPNKCDRIHAWILWRCAKDYGPSFWQDFFREVRKEAKALNDAVRLGEADCIRNARYRITVDCFDRLAGLDFKERLRKSRISLTTDVKSLHPEDPQWDRRLIETTPAPGASNRPLSRPLAPDAQTIR